MPKATYNEHVNPWDEDFFGIFTHEMSQGEDTDDSLRIQEGMHNEFCECPKCLGDDFSWRSHKNAKARKSKLDDTVRFRQRTHVSDFV